MNNFKKIQKQKKMGIAAVEFALIGPVFFALILFAIQGGIIMSQWSVLQWCCNHAARDMMISQSPNTDNMITSAKKYEQQQGYSDVISFTAQQTTCGIQQCMIISGTMNYNFQIGTYNLGSYTMKSTATAPIADIYIK